MGLKVHKTGQGFWTRFLTFMLSAAMCLFAAYKMYYYFESDFWLGEVPGAGAIPVVGTWLSNGFLVSAGFFVVLTLVSYWACFCHEKWSEFLIETEAEMRKVSWPNKEELINSSTVVVIAVFLFSAYLGLIDFGLGWFFDYLFLPQG